MEILNKNTTFAAKKIKDWVSLSLFSVSARAQQFTLLHGPYLQEVGTEAATVVYETSDKAFTWVEVKPHGASDDEARRCYTSRDGLREAFNTFGSVRVKELKPACSYDYCIVSKQMKEFQPYKVTFKLLDGPEIPQIGTVQGQA